MVYNRQVSPKKKEFEGMGTKKEAAVISFLSGGTVLNLINYCLLNNMKNLA